MTILTIDDNWESKGGLGGAFKRIHDLNTLNAASPFSKRVSDQSGKRIQNIYYES